MEKLYRLISSLGEKYNAKKVVLFGSRARGDNRERSDIDIAVYSMPEKNQGLFLQEIENLPTLLCFDVVFVTEKTSKALLDNIERDGIVLMNKFNENFEKLKNATDRLSESVKEYNELGISTIRDGAIKRFEFCSELAWKTLREYLIDEGYTDINSPKSVMKQAYADGILKDGDLWLDIINARNLTAHVYDEETSIEIFEKISKIYLPAFVELTEALEK